jgi:antitoxin ParD1/3/4
MARTTLNISLTPELEEFVDSRVSSGRYQSASEVVRQGLRLLQEQEMTREAQLDRLRSQIDLGLDQARRGELLDGEAVFDELERRASELDRSR